MMTSFKLISLFLFASLSIGGLIAQPASQESAATIINEVHSVADVGAPVLPCTVNLPPGHFILAESFFENYDYAFRRVAKLRAYGFKNVMLMHTDCQPVDVAGSYYYVTLSPVVASKNDLYPLVEDCWTRSTGVDCPLINTRIIEAKR